MAILTVTNINDSGVGSLRQAIAEAQSGDRIRFASKLANKKITLNSGQLTIDKNLIIDGSDAPGITISGNKSDRVFYIGKGIAATLKDLAIVDGKSNDGGGIKVEQEGSELTLINARIDNNVGKITGGLFVGWKSTANVINSSFNNNDGTAAEPTSKNAGFSAGAISTWGSATLSIEGTTFDNNKGYNGGAIYSIFSTLSIEDSDFINNVSTSRAGGGAIFNDGIGRIKGEPTADEKIYIHGSRFEGNKAEKAGGALAFWGYGKDSVIIEDSIIINNEVVRNSDDKYGRGGGIAASNIGLTLRNTTIANNTAEGQGGGLWIETNSQTLPVNIVNSTISGNQVTDDAGGGAFLNTRSTPVNITNSTIAYNNAGRANGALWFGKNHDITLKNSIVAFNTAERDLRQQQVGYQAKDGGGNVEFSPVSQAKRVVAGSLVADPLLSSLQEIDGTLVHSLLPDSPAIDAGINKNAPTVDQRGLTRDSQIDSGAFEAGVSEQENTIVGEVGYVENVNHLEQIIQLQNEYIDPVVFVSPLSFNGGDPAIVRITDIQSDRFEVFVQESDLRYKETHSGYHVPESFSYLVVEAGEWTMPDGTVIEVGLTEVSNKTVSDTWKTVEFDNTFSSPTVISSIQTYNNDELLRLRQRNGDLDSIEMAMEKEEALVGTSYATETVGYLAIESGSQADSSDQTNIDYLADHTGKSVNHKWYDLEVNDYPHLFASIDSYNGRDSAGLRQQLGSIKVEEDTSRDFEMNHVTEEIAYLGFGNTGNLTAIV